MCAHLNKKNDNTDNQKCKIKYERNIYRAWLEFLD